MTSIMGYCDNWSVAPGDTVRFMVSCVGAETYDAEIVRLVAPAAGPLASPFVTPVVETPVNRRYRARRQDVHAGSFGVVEGGPAIRALESFTLQAYVWPTTPGRGAQALLGTWSEGSKRGFGLCLGSDGAPELRIGDGAQVATLGTGVPLLTRRWYFVAASFDAATGTMTVLQQPVGDTTFHAERPVRRSTTTALRPAAGPGPFLFAAWHKGLADHPTAWRSLVAGGFYNGKIDRPRLAGRALDDAEMAALAGSSWPAGLETAVVAAWDFSRGISSDRLVDTAPNRLHGEAVNLPARAMTGHNWSGRSNDWTRLPEEYGAIHFHDDDIYDCNWEPDFALSVPDGLQSGIYAARLTSQEAEFFIPFFVRPAPGAATAKIAFLASTSTYTVYINNRGRFATAATELFQGRLTVMDDVDMLMMDFPAIGVSTYDRHSDGSGVCYSSRLRPATNIKPKGRHWNFNLDLFIIDWLEKVGLPYDVVTEDDLHREGVALLRPYNVVLTGSHPEYDTKEMLDALDAYVRRGGRLMYMGGNGFYWRIAYHPTRPGVIEVRRGEGAVRAWDAAVGEYHTSFTGEYSGLWRHSGRPPQRIGGVGFISQGFDKCSYYRRTDASRDPRAAWMFEGVEEEIVGDFGILQGGAAGLEIDSADVALGTPPHALVVARSENHSNTYELVTEEVRVPHGATNAVQNPQIHADMVFFEAPNGGAVWATGSIAYAGSLGWNGFDNNIFRITTNVLRRFADPAPFPMPDGGGGGGDD